LLYALQGGQNGLMADGVAVTREMMRLLLNQSRSGDPAETYRSHGLGGATACGTGYAGDRHAEVRMTASQGAPCHVLCGLQ